MRYHYGDDVFEKIPLDKIPTGARSEIIDVMSKVEAPPIKTEAPKTPGGYLTPGEYRANIEEMQKIEDAIKRRESRFADMTDEEIQNELAQYGGKRSSFEMGLEFDYPEEYAKYKTPKKPEPEEKADGGRIGYSKGKRVKSSIDKLLEKLNTKLSKKTSMESVDPKTGEVTVPKKPIRRAEEPTGVTVMDPEPEIVDERSITKNKSRQLTQDEIADYEELMGRDSEQWMSEGTVEEAEKALKRSKAEEAYYRTQYKLGKLDPSPGEQTEARMKFLQKKLEEAELTKDRRLITPNEINELDDLENIFAKDLTQTNEQALENEMNRVLNQYDKSMFIKDAQGMVDVSNPANAEKMALLLKRDHPEIYNKIFKLTEDINQKQVLDEFDITGREPNAKGGIAGLL
jgi:ribosomal protein L29